MRALFIAPRYYLYVRGTDTEYVVKSIVKRLVKKGHKEIVILDDNIDKFWETPIIKVHEVR